MPFGNTEAEGDSRPCLRTFTAQVTETWVSGVQRQCLLLVKMSWTGLPLQYASSGCGWLTRNCPGLPPVQPSFVKVRQGAAEGIHGHAVGAARRRLGCNVIRVQTRVHRVLRTWRSEAPPWLLRSPDAPLTPADPRLSMMASRRSGKLENSAKVLSSGPDRDSSSSSTWHGQGR
jgi:hypothetical protein